MKEYTYTIKTMGTDALISIVSNSEALTKVLAEQAMGKIKIYEKRFSRFLPTSELSQLNKERKMKVSPSFLKVTTEAHKLFCITQGIFNPLVQISRLGYDTDFKDIKNDALQTVPKVYNIDFSSTVINLLDSVIELQPGQKLDFGGFLKGYLAEELCKEIKNSSNDIIGVIVNIGGDIHTQGLDSHNEKFIFTIYNPITHEEIPIPVYNKSLATSGTYKRNWIKSDTNFHHILDASGTKNPDTDVISVSIIHDSGGVSEAYAKTFLSLGPTQAQEILEDKNIIFISINKKGQITQNIA